MLIKPSIDSLLEKVENKYALVVLSSARARQLRESLLSIDPDDPEEQDSRLLKEVSVALEEVNQGKIDITYLDNYMEEMRKAKEAQNNHSEEDEE